MPSARPRRHRVAVTDRRDLEPAAEGRHTITGTTPGIELDPADLGEGWAVFSLRYRPGAGRTTVAPTLWHYTETNHQFPARVRLEPGRNHIFTKVLYLPGDITRAGIDFPAAYGVVELGDPGLTRLSRPEAMARMAARLGVEAARDPSAGRLSVTRGWRHLRHGGVGGLRRRLVARYQDTDGHGRAGGTIDYEDWLAVHGTLSERDRRAIRAAIAQLDDPPTISVVLPVFDTPERWLRRAVDSVRDQLYPHWQLCIADDASPSPHVARVLASYADDERIVVTRRATNGHISAASNTALGTATGDWVALLDHDDELAPEALAALALEIAARPDVDLWYSDEDKVDTGGHRYDGHFKPGFNRTLLYAQNYVGHLLCIRRSLVEAVGGFREGFEGSQDYDLILRCVAHLDTNRPGGADEHVGHLPQVLYHWRAIAGSTALETGEKDYATRAGMAALADHLATEEVEATVEPGMVPTTYRVCHPLPEPPPRVSLLIPTRNGADILATCIDSVRARSTYPDIEIVVVDNQSDEPDSVAYLTSLADEGVATVVPYDAPFNYSAINNLAAGHATGDVLVLLNNDMEVITPDWLEELVARALQPDVGAVGAKLRYPDGTIQHHGVVTGIGGVAGHGHKTADAHAYGYFARLVLPHEVGAVTGACLVTRREVWDRLGGLDEQSLAVAFNDIDYCMKCWDAGLKVLVTPWAELYHHESKSRGPEDTPVKQARMAYEAAVMQDRWGARLLHDPSYSPHLTLDHENFGIAEVSRVTPRWHQ